MQHKIEYLPRKPVEEHWVWGKTTEVVVCTLILCMALPVLAVMAIWVAHQLASMGV